MSMSNQTITTSPYTREVYVRLGALTDVGQLREHNEDNFLVCSNLEENNWFLVEKPFVLSGWGSLLVVADGMGGENAGEIASALATEAVRDYFTALIKKPRPTLGEIPQLLEKSILYAHRHIVEHARQNPEYAGMGTTILIAWVLNPYAYVAWSGDSRCYVFNEADGLKIASNDHSVVWELVLDGKLDVDEAENHPNSHIITQSLGDGEHPPQPDVTVQELRPGSKLLLCSDGLNGMVNTQTILSILRKPKSPGETCKELIRVANQNGGEDNITVLLLEVLGNAPDVTEPVSETVADSVTTTQPLPVKSGEIRMKNEAIAKTYHTQRRIVKPSLQSRKRIQAWWIALGSLLLVVLFLLLYLLYFN